MGKSFGSQCEVVGKPFVWKSLRSRRSTAGRQPYGHVLVHCVLPQFVVLIFFERWLDLKSRSRREVVGELWRSRWEVVGESLGSRWADFGSRWEVVWKPCGCRWEVVAKSLGICWEVVGKSWGSRGPAAGLRPYLQVLLQFVLLQFALLHCFVF